jgi:gliding motility-associated-like protein
MKRILLFFVTAFFLTGSVHAQLIDAEPEVSNICAGGNATLTATVTAPGNSGVPGSLPTNSYAISSIPFSPAPLTGGTSTSASDDSQVGPLPIGFNFCFFGSTYSNFYIGSNGWLAFSSQPTTYTSASIPNTGGTIPKNCIMGPWQDWNPGISGGPYINYQTSGTAPNRKLVVNWNNIPMYGSACTGLTGTFQVIIYETSNVIENYIVSKSSGCSWAGGTAVQGIHNAAGTVAFTVPGRNSTVWSANNEGWRYTPNGTATYTINWYILPANTLIGTGSPINVTPVTTPQYYYAKVVGPNGCGTGSNNTDTVVVNSVPMPVDAGTDVTICPGTSTMLNATGGTTYSWSPATGLSDPNIANPIASPTSTTVYSVMATGPFGCTGFDNVTVNVQSAPLVDAGPGSTICPGENIQLGGNASAGTYFWSPTGSLDDPTILTPVAMPAITTTYTLTVTDANGCNASSTTTVTIGSPAVDAGPNAAVCPGTSTTLNASGGDTYSWSPSTGLSDPAIPNPIASPVVTTTYTVNVFSNGSGCSGTDSVTIIVRPAVMADAGNSISICSGDDTTLTASGGVTYSWSPAASLSNPNINNPVASPQSGTTYTVVVTDVFGCTGTDSVGVIVNQLPFVTAGNDISICPTDSANLMATGAFSYYWTPGLTLSNDSISNPLASPSVQTDYIVIGTDVNGCIDTDTITISLNGFTMNTGQNATICRGDSTVISAFGAATYSWTPVASLNNPTLSSPLAKPLTTTTYTVIGTSGSGCKDTAFVTVNVNSLPPVNAGTSLSTCVGGNANLSVAGANSYVWTPAASLNNAFIATPIATPAVTTLYTVTGTDLNGCRASDTISVIVHSLPPASAGTNTGICLGSSITLNGSGGGSYSWSPSSALSSNNIANPVATPTVTTTYTVTVTGAGFCTSSSQVTITVNQVPIANAGADANICNGASATLSASGGATYFWAPSTGLSSTTVANPTASPASTTQYTVTVSNLSGCTSQDSVIVNVNNAITIAPSTIIDETCTGGNGSITAGAVSGGTSPYQYSLNGGLNQSSPTFGSLSHGAYLVTVTDASGCLSSQTINIGQLVNVNASFTADPSSGANPLNVNFTNTSTGATSYIWDLGNGLPSIGTDPSTIYTAAGTYTVMLIASNGGYPCVDTAYFTIDVYEESVIIIPNIFTPNGDGKNDVFRIQATGVSEVKGIIFNRWGKKIYDWNGGADSGWDGKINGSNAADGTYYFVLTIRGVDGKEKEEKGYLQLLSE